MVGVNWISILDFASSTLIKSSWTTFNCSKVKGCSGSLIRRMMSKISCFVTRSRPLLLLSLLLLLSPTLDTFSSKVNICEGLLLSVVLLPTGLRKEAKVVRVEEVGTVTEESFNL